MTTRRRSRLAASRKGEGGFTLTELMIAIAILGIASTYVSTIFIKGYQLWKRNFDDLILQQTTRLAMSQITRAVREASPGTVKISTPAGMPRFSRIDFTDGRGQTWSFCQVLKGKERGKNVYTVKSLLTYTSGTSVTQYMADYVESLSFVYPSFQDVGLIDVGLTMKKTPYLGGGMPVLSQLVERVMLRNP